MLTWDARAWRARFAVTTPTNRLESVEMNDEQLRAIEQHVTPWAQADADEIRARLEAADIPNDGTVCLVDGSAYSPSWRALDGGAHVWALLDGGEACEIYEEALDALVEAHSERLGVTVFWQDGCLYAAGPDVDYEEMLW